MMSQPQTVLAERADANASLGELLRARALTSAPARLFGQLAVGVAINSALLLWFPKGWGIATAGMATVLLHSLWCVAVRRTSGASYDETGDSMQAQTAPEGWWQVRRVAAVTSATSALVLMWFVCLFMLGRLMS